jgi:hypothetical protein
LVVTQLITATPFEAAIVADKARIGRNDLFMEKSGRPCR